MLSRAGTQSWRLAGHPRELRWSPRQALAAAPTCRESPEEVAINGRPRREPFPEPSAVARSTAMMATATMVANLATVGRCLLPPRGP